MAKVALINVSGGPKVLNALPVIVLQAGQGTDGEVEISDAELAAVEATGWFEVVAEAEDAPAIGKMTVAELKDFAELNGIDLGDATKKDDILSAIELALEAKG